MIPAFPVSFLCDGAPYLGLTDREALRVFLCHPVGGRPVLCETWGARFSQAWRATIPAHVPLPPGLPLDAIRAGLTVLDLAGVEGTVAFALFCRELAAAPPPPPPSCQIAPSPGV